MNIKLYLICFLLTTFMAAASAQLETSSDLSTLELLETLLGEGIQANTLTFTGESTQQGSFNATATNLGLDSGIMLSTGEIHAAAGPNDVSGSSYAHNAPGDFDLDNILSSSIPTFDAAVIEFNFIPQFNTLLLDYVFASEEYPEFVCSEFNDIFAFLLSGPKPDGGSYNKYNVAMIPGTTLPVAINTINPGEPIGNGCTGSAGSLEYSDLYIDNSGGTFIQYDGFTVPLQMTTPVIAGETYTIKIAIADVGDAVFDSAVFLVGNSFKSLQITDIEDVEHLNTFNIQPNPSNGRFVIHAEFELTQTATIQIINALGQEIYQSKNTKKHITEQINISDAPIGTYFVILQTENGKAVQKIAISR